MAESLLISGLRLERYEVFRPNPLCDHQSSNRELLFVAICGDTGVRLINIHKLCCILDMRATQLNLIGIVMILGDWLRELPMKRYHAEFYYI